MKKLFLIVVIALLPLSLYLGQNTYSFYEVFKNLNNKTFCYVYNLQNIEEENKNILLNNKNFKTLKNGNKQFVYFKSSQPQISCRPQYLQVEANLSVMEVKEILKTLNAKIVESDFYEDTYIIYCYTPIFSNCVILNNKKINLQFAINKFVTTIGYPMIYGSF